MRNYDTQIAKEMKIILGQIARAEHLEDHKLLHEV